MADILKTSPVLVAPGPSANRPDDTRARETGESESAAATPASFASLLKSRSDRLANADGAKASAMADGAEAKVETPIADASALLSALGATPAADPLVGLADTGPATTAAQDPANGDAAAILAGITPIGVAASGPVAEQAIGPMTQANNASLPEAAGATVSIAAPLPAAIAVSPAPTSGRRTEARDGQASELAGQAPRPSGAAADRIATTDKLAGGPAISAENTGSTPLAGTAGEGVTEFRSTLDRIATHSGNLAVQVGGTSQANQSPPSLRVDSGIGQAGWAQEVGDKLSWMAGNGRQQADLVLNPPQLGRIEVSVVIEGDTVSATFASANATVREALENSISRLREVMADAGIALGDTHVGSQFRQDNGPALAKGDRNAAGQVFDDPSAAAAAGGGSTWRIASGRGMVDVFA